MNSLKKTVLLFCILVICSACSFNRSFYPTHYKKNAVFKQSSFNYKDFFLETKNKKKIHCAEFLCKEDSAKGLVVYFHGNSGPIASYQSVAETFAANGYNCLMVDFQGYGQSSGKGTHKSFLESGRTAARYLREEGYKIPVIVYGYSIGGHLSVKITEENQDIIDLLIMEAAFTSHKEIAVESVGKGLRGLARLLIANHYKGSKYIEGISIPKLIIHSTEDKVAPYWMAEKYYKNAIEKKALWTIDGAHGGALKYHEEFIRRMEQMLKLNQ